MTNTNCRNIEEGLAAATALAFPPSAFAGGVAQGAAENQPVAALFSPVFRSIQFSKTCLEQTLMSPPGLIVQPYAMEC
jgi:hypothetical protein